MDYLQYSKNLFPSASTKASVLNLVINGLPSIHDDLIYGGDIDKISFKPCYKWITFNTGVIHEINVYYSCEF